jgi:hypothetical protein
MSSGSALIHSGRVETNTKALCVRNHYRYVASFEWTASAFEKRWRSLSVTPNASGSPASLTDNAEAAQTAFPVESSSSARRATTLSSSA